MNRLATLIALVIVVCLVSAGISSRSGASLVVTTALLATGVIAYKFVGGAVPATIDVNVSPFRQFVVCVARNVVRFAIGAVVIAWTVVSALWFASGG